MRLSACINPNRAEEITIERNIPLLELGNLCKKNKRMIPRKMISSKKPTLKHVIKNIITVEKGFVNSVCPEKKATNGKLLIEISNAGTIITKDFKKGFLRGLRILNLE